MRKCALGKRKNVLGRENASIRGKPLDALRGWW